MSVANTTTGHSLANFESHEISIIEGEKKSYKDIHTLLATQYFPTISLSQNFRFTEPFFKVSAGARSNVQ
jgi:hypothetical protein